MVLARCATTKKPRGGVAVFPEMKVLTVEVHKWLTFPATCSSERAVV
jgi:hypothetical protein